MIKKILIAEDIDSINTGIITILNEKFSFSIEHANSCDNAILKLRNSKKICEPFDLLISDLSFKTDGFLTPKITNGVVLVHEAKVILPSIKTLVYTIEDKPTLLRKLTEDMDVDGLVLKGLNSLLELCKAIDQINDGEKYYTSEVLQIIKKETTTTIEEYDILLLEKLANGLTQDEISKNFKQSNISPSSVSGVEKRINRLKSILQARNNIQMVAIAKDMCLI